jgi:hypothetical protein
VSNGSRKAQKDKVTGRIRWVSKRFLGVGLPSLATRQRTARTAMKFFGRSSILMKVKRQEIPQVLGMLDDPDVLTPLTGTNQSFGHRAIF